MIAINKTPKSIQEANGDKKHKLFLSHDENVPAKGEGDEDWFSDYEGQLAVDVYQTPSNIVIKAPIAGVRPDEIDVAIADDVVTIKGERKSEIAVAKENYYYQRAVWNMPYWEGAFSLLSISPH